MTSAEIEWTIILSSLMFLGLVCFIAMLLVLNTNRRIRHRAQLAELQQQQASAVMDAEREATQHTLRELGRELHDNVGQLLAVAQLGVNTVLEEAPDNPWSSPEQVERLSAARDALEQGTDEVRRLGHDLNSDLWQQRSLVDAISAEAERLERVARVQVHLLVTGTPPVLEPGTSTVLFRVFQVIITNALKHSGADVIDITISGGPHIALTITDNGVGFDPEHTTANAGLVNIHKRCALIGFAARCTTAPGGGCTWHLQPLPEHEA